LLLPKGTVFAVVDGEHFELYRNSGTESDPNLEALETPALEATNYSAGARDHDKISRFTAGAPKDKLDKLEESASVTAVTEWLNQQVLQHKIDKLVIIADPRSLGEMRHHYHKTLRDALICDLDRNMTGRPPEDIVKALRAVS
jgi:protein required for attachment to host cells